MKPLFAVLALVLTSGCGETQPVEPAPKLYTSQEVNALLLKVSPDVFDCGKRVGQGEPYSYGCAQLKWLWKRDMDRATSEKGGK